MKDKQKLILSALVIILAFSQALLFFNQIESRENLQIHPIHSTALDDDLISPQESTRNLETASIKFLETDRSGILHQQQGKYESLFQQRFTLILVFDEIGCSDCIWKALYSLNNRLENIKISGGSAIAIADSGAAEEVQRLSTALRLNYPVVLTSNISALFSGSIEWKPPVMLLFDGNLNRIVYARYEDGYDSERETFLDKALRLYKFSEVSDSMFRQRRTINRP